MLNARPVARWLVMIAITLTAAAGCGGSAPTGPRLYAVTGTVSFTGEPLKEADLLIRSADGKHAAGTKVADGKFKVNVPAGTSIVEITAMRDVPGQFKEENPGERVAVKEQFIPTKYNSESTLKLDVKPDTKDVKFDLMP